MPSEGGAGIVMKKTGRVLIVDSNARLREKIAPVLGEVGLQIHFCTDIASACDLARRFRPAVVLLDAVIAREDLKACHKLRRCVPEYHLPILLLVPLSYTDIASCLCSSEADDFLCCPFQREELLARVLARVDDVESRYVESFTQIDYRFLAGLSNLANADLDTTQVLKRVVDTISQVIDVHRCSITMVREDEKFGYVMASNDDPDLNGLKINLEKYPEIQETIRTGKPLLIDNIYHHPLMEGVRPYLAKLGFNSLLVLPMVDKQRVIGVLVVRTARSIEGFAEQEISFCQLVANVATSALRYARLIEDRIPTAAESLAGGQLKEDFFETKGGLLDMAAHDLRLLVSVIDGYGLLLNEADDGNLTPQQREFVDGLMTGCRRLVELTNNLLDFSRIEAGKLELNVSRTDLRQLIETAIEDIQPLIRRRGITLDIQARTHQMHTRCDGENIRRVFYNLMSNAIKFTPQGGQIELLFNADDKNAFVSIADNGPGICANLLPRLFEEFNHGRSPDGQHGNGLGLSICKHIVDAHQGRIWAESIVGQGSRFTFSLPITA